MKTTKEWFETLHENYKSKALKNMEAPLAKHHSLLGAISNGFDWNKTPEGIDYWKQVFREIKLGIEPPEIETKLEVVETPKIEKTQSLIETKESEVEDQPFVRQTFTPPSVSQMSSLNELNFSMKK